MIQRPVEAASLASRLRTATRDAHVAAERAFDLDARLVDRHEYAGLLAALHPFHAGAEARLARVPGWGELDPAIDVAARRRAFLLVRDLDAMGVATPEPEPEELLGLPVLDGMPAALGCLYVLEGSLLGGGVIARSARARLGDVPIGFLSGGGRRVGAGWRSLQLTLDTFGRAHDEAARAEVVAGARATFASFTGRLARQVQAA